MVGKSRPPTLLIDGDLILFRACAAVEREVRWDDDHHVLFSDFSDAQEAVEMSINGLFERLGSDRHVIALTQGPTFRHKLSPSYKANRAGQRKPLCMSRAVEWLMENYRVVRFQGLEADDVLGIFSTRDHNTILCSADKDMRTIPGRLWDGKDLRAISQDEADYWHMYQTLVGDSSDGYPGCPGIGPKRAEELLRSQSGPIWPVVVGAFKKAKLTEDDALLQARLARILRNEDWDAKHKEPILWMPPPQTP